MKVISTLLIIPYELIDSEILFKIAILFLQGKLTHLLISTLCKTWFIGVEKHINSILFRNLSFALTYLKVNKNIHKQHKT